MEKTKVKDAQLAIRSLKTAHIICDLSFNVITSNDAANKFLQLALINSSNNLLDLIDNWLHSEFIKAIQNTAEDGISRSVIDSRLIAGEISKCDISRISELLLIEVSEISETQRVLARERVELNRNSAILEAINNSVLVIDFVDKTLVSNKQCQEIFGDYLELESIFFAPYFELATFNPNSEINISHINLEFINALKEVWSSGISRNDLLTTTKQDQKTLLYRTIVRWDYCEIPRGIIISGTDVSKLVRYKQEVETSQLQVRELLRNMNIWIVIFDESTGHAELYFPDGTRFIQERFIENLSESKQILIKDAISELYQNGFASIVAPSEAGDRIIRTSISFASDGSNGSRKILAINSDVTEKVQYEELENRRAQMAQIQKFAQGIAHDFGNISQSIQGFTKLLEKEELSDNGREILKNLDISSSRALNVSRKISEISRIQVLENSHFDLIEYLNKNSDFLKDFLGDQISLEIEHPDSLNGQVFANHEQIERIIENILENACHAMNGSGKINIRCSENLESEDFILEIVNDGPAIPKQIADRIFMPFVSGRKEGGTGLGLYLAFEYLNSCGGKIDLHNQNHNVSLKLSIPKNSRK